MRYACIVHDVVHSSQSFQDLDALCLCRIVTATLSCLTTGCLLLCALFRCVLSQSTHTSSHQCHSDKNRYYSTECTGTGTGNTDREQGKKKKKKKLCGDMPTLHLGLIAFFYSLAVGLLAQTIYRLSAGAYALHRVDHTSILPLHTSSRPGQSDT